MFILVGILVQPDDPKPDTSPFLRIFHRVRKKVDQDLIDPRLIADQSAMLKSRHGDLKGLVLGVGRRTDDRVYGGDHIIHRDLSDRQHHLAALDLRDIQHIINKA